MKITAALQIASRLGELWRWRWRIIYQLISPSIGRAQSIRHPKITNCDLRKMMANKKNIEPVDLPEHAQHIVFARGAPVLLDRDVAKLFNVEVRKLNQQVTRNKDRFLEEFAFRLEWEEFETLRSQNVILQEWTKVTYPPIAFTDYGVVMAATVLKSPEAISATQAIVRSFVEIRKQAWEKEVSKRLGNQLPLALDAPTRQGLATKLNVALGHVLDAIVDPTENRTVKDEAREIAAEGLRALKAFLEKAGINNEKTLAEVRRIMAEAEAIEVDAQRKRTEHKHRELALLAKKLRLVIQAQAYAETGSVDGLMAVLQDLEKE